MKLEKKIVELITSDAFPENFGEVNELLNRIFHQRLPQDQRKFFGNDPEALSSYQRLADLEDA